jgi:transposase-like protein
MPKAKKVYTPGSKPPKVQTAGRGRPKKKKDRKSRKGNYRTKYNQEAMRQAVQAVADKRMTMTEASKHYQVPKTTLHDRLHERVSERVGRPTVLSPEEEQIIVERLVLMGEWGYPLTCRDLRQLIKSYLDGLGRATRFPNNLPGRDFVAGKGLLVIY